MPMQSPNSQDTSSRLNFYSRASGFEVRSDRDVGLVCNVKPVQGLRATYPKNIADAMLQAPERMHRENLE